MTAAKFTWTKRLVAMRILNREPIQLRTLERHAKATMLLKASTAEVVRSNLDRLDQQMLPAFEEEVFTGGFEDVDFREKTVSDARLADLNKEIKSLIGLLHKQIHLLRGSKMISYVEAQEFKRNLSRLEDRYFESASFGNPHLGLCFSTHDRVPTHCATSEPTVHQWQFISCFQMCRLLGSTECQCGSAI
jgi:hypothetical protein